MDRGRRATTAEWQLRPAGTRTRAWLYLLCVAVPLSAVGLSMIPALLLGTPAAIPGEGRLGALAAFFGLALLSTGIAWRLDRRLQRHALEFDRDGPSLRLHTTFYSRCLPLSELRLHQARLIDLDEQAGFRPMLETNAFALPGFQSGWFRLRNLDKALVARAGGRKVLWLPTALGYGLLLQPGHPQALLEKIKELAAGAGGR